MRKETSLTFVRWAGLSALALAFAAIGQPCRAETAARAKSAVADWPAPSRLTALALIEKYGAPRRADSLRCLCRAPEVDRGAGAGQHNRCVRVPDRLTSWQILPSRL